MVRTQHSVSPQSPSSPQSKSSQQSQTPSGHWSLSIVVGTLIGPVAFRETTAGAVAEIDVQTLPLLALSTPSTSKVSVSVVGPATLFDHLSAGDEVVVVGTTRRRFFRSGGATVTRTEVEAHNICLRTNKRGTKQLFAEIRAELDIAITTPAGPSIPRRNG